MYKDAKKLLATVEETSNKLEKRFRTTTYAPHDIDTKTKQVT